MDKSRKYDHSIGGGRSESNHALSPIIPYSNKAPIANIIEFYDSRSNPKWTFGKTARIDGKNPRPISVAENELASMLGSIHLKENENLTAQQTESPRDRGFIWVHLLDMSILPLVALKFRMHDLCRNAFFDCRCHSSVVKVRQEMVVSICVMQMVNVSHVSICKYVIDLTYRKSMPQVIRTRLFVYIAEGIVVTLQVSVLRDDESAITSNTGPEVGPSLVKEEQSLTKGVFINCAAIHTQCCQLGPAYLLHILFLQALAQQEPCVEFLSWAICYFNRRVHVDLSHKEKVAVLLKMHIVQHSIAMMLNTSNEVSRVLRQIIGFFSVVHHPHGLFYFSFFAATR